MITMTIMAPKLTNMEYSPDAWRVKTGGLIRLSRAGWQDG